MPIQESELDLAAGHGDDGIAFPQHVAGLEGPHLSSRVADKCLTFNGDDGGDCLGGGNARIHGLIFFKSGLAGPFGPIYLA